MAWKGGFSGRGFTREEFRIWLKAIKKPIHAKFLVVHNTGAPYIKPSVGGPARIRNLANYYRNEKRWSSAPHGFVIYDRFYAGTPFHEIGTHSPSWNGISLGIECEGDYRAGKHNPKIGDGAVAWHTMAWVFAELLTWLGWEATPERIRLHREDSRTTHACPGNLINKDWFIDKVRAAMGAKPIPTKPAEPKPANKPRPLPTQLYDVKEIQQRLLVHGYSLPKYGADGKPGLELDAAIKAMQADLRITPSGLVGPWMMDQLKKAPPAKPVPIQPEPVLVPKVPPVVVKPEPITPPTSVDTNPLKAMRLLTTGSVLWPRHWAAGAVAQAQRESYPDLRPWAQGDWKLHGQFVPNNKANRDAGAKPTAFGIWQLREDRYDNYLSFAEARGKSWEDFETQVLWCPYELKTSEKLAWRWLQRAETVEQACAAMTWYERPRGYNPAKAKAATTWDEVFAVSEKCDGWEIRLGFAKALM